MNPDVAAYLALQPEPQRSVLERMHSVAMKAIPETEDVISYGIVGFRYKKKVPFFISGWKNHVSIHGGRVLGNRVAELFDNVKVVGTTIQIDPAKPLTDELLISIIKLRLEIFDESGGRQ
ncbi:MAG: hypothetical protein RL174_127 [Actinomycetota bacterium]|jgi:uncharacterized protein YdhG (YjbR/CyaY superfamily)